MQCVWCTIIMTMHPALFVQSQLTAKHTPCTVTIVISGVIYKIIVIIETDMCSFKNIIRD